MSSVALIVGYAVLAVVALYVAALAVEFIIHWLQPRKKFVRLWRIGFNVDPSNVGGFITAVRWANQEWVCLYWRFFWRARP